MKHRTAGLDLELARLEAEYGRRAYNNLYTERYSYFNAAALFHVHSLERNLLTLLKRHKLVPLTEKKILDVGCGSGSHLRRFLDYGALPSNLSGVDLMAPRIEQARQLHSGLDWRIGSAHNLPYADATFDLVMSFVVFSSILDASLRQKMVDEMWRVRRPGGVLLVHDFTYSNPRNTAVQGINLRKTRELFARPGVHFDFRRITLAPPISRIIAPRSYWLTNTLEQCKVFNTHFICIISLDEPKQ